MIQGSWRRDVRRITAGLVGTAVAATTIGLAAPAQAAQSSIGGLVVDAAGNPMTGTIEVYRHDSYDDTYDSWGQLGLDNGVIEGTLSDGVYKLEAVGNGGYSEFYRDKADLASADAITVAGGAPVALSGWVVDQPYVTATVTDAAGKPVRGVEVFAFDAADYTDVVSSDTADEDGKVVLPVTSAPVKLYTYTGDSNVPLAGEWFSDKVDFASADPVTGTPGGTQVPISLSAGATMTGQVLSDAGAPLEQIRVTASSDLDQGSDVTDKNGVFVIEGLAPGSYDVRFADPLIDEYTTEYFDNAATSGTATKIPVPLNGYVPNVNARLAPKTPEPAGSVELTGVLTDDAGTPVAGAPVNVWNTPAAPFKEESTTAYSNRSGVYSFDDLDALSGKAVKVQAQAPTAGGEEDYSLFGQWFGQRTSYDRATAVGVASGVPARADITMPRAGGIAGSVTGTSSQAVQGGVSVLSVDGMHAGSTGTKADNTFDMRWLYPGTYKVLFSDYAGNNVPEWWKNSDFEGAKTITVKSGQTVTGLDAVLDASLSTTQRPSVKGYPWVGKTFRVDPGEWNFETGTQYSYEWLIGSKVVGTGSSYIPTKQQIGDRLKVRVLAENGELSGMATTARSAKIGYKSKIKAKIRGDRAFIKIKAQKIKGKKVKGKITVKEIVRVKDNGTIKYKKIGKTKIKRAKGTVSLKKLKKGKHKIVFFFKGKGKVGSSELTKKVKTKR